VNGGDCPMAFVYQQNRQAIGGFHAGKKAWRVGQQGIALSQTSGAIGVDGDIGMDLTQGCQGLGRIEESGTESVFQPVEPAESAGAVSVLKEVEIRRFYSDS
jgi:hypothetical protein